MTAADEIEWRLLAEVLENRFGLEFDDMRRGFLEARLRVRATQMGLPSLLDYYHYVLHHPAGPEEMNTLKRLATNHETYFFRADHQLAVLATDSLAALAGRHPGPFRVLSAGCSCGEEAYSIAIHLQRSGRYTAGFRIDAFDLDPECIDQARSNVYRAASLRACSDAQKAEYFTASGTDTFSVREPYRRNVRFLDLNLLGGIPPSAEPYDLIFCRNVLIYFSAAAFERAIATLASWMLPGSLLALGHSETLMRRASPFMPEVVAGCVLYRRK